MSVISQTYAEFVRFCSVLMILKVLTDVQEKRLDPNTVCFTILKFSGHALNIELLDKYSFVLIRLLFIRLLLDREHKSYL